MNDSADKEIDEEEGSLVACPVCGGLWASSCMEIFDDRYGCPGNFKVVRCDSCGHLMTYPRLRDSELEYLYGTYYPRKDIIADQIRREAAKVNLALGGLRRWWMGVDNQGQYLAKPGEKMLDLGCGGGLSLLQAKLRGVDAWGIEADPNVKRLAQELDLAVHQGSLFDKPFADVDFDLIVLNQVIEHIPEPDKALREIRSRLSRGGRVVLVFPNIGSLWCRLSRSHWINWHVPYHQHHFTLARFTQMAQRCGFRVVRSRTITPNGWTLLQIRANRQSIMEGEVNPMWQVKPPPQATDPSALTSSVVWKKLLRIPVFVLLGILNRLIDILGYGDSLMVELRPDDRVRQQ